MFKIGQAKIEFRVEEKSSQAKTYTCDQIHMGIGPNHTLLLSSERGSLVPPPPLKVGLSGLPNVLYNKIFTYKKVWNEP